MTDEAPETQTWPARWNADYFADRFGSDTPFSGPRAHNTVNDVVQGFPFEVTPGEAVRPTPVAIPDGRDFARARAAVGLPAKAIRDVLTFDEWRLEENERGDSVVHGGTYSHDNGYPLAFQRLCGALYSFLSLSDAAVARETKPTARKPRKAATTKPEGVSK